jgi:flagellar biosynthesis protein FlhF
VQIKQFSGATIDEVLTKVREELGEDAVILQTKRVVTGGIGGFFGREGVEVTAAEGMPAGEGERANREAAASVAAAPALEATTADVEDEAGADDADAFVPTPFGRHLDTRLAAAEEAEAMAPPAAAPASPAAAYARAAAPAAPAAPFAPGDRERTQAIIEAARAAVREAHDQAIVDPPLLPEAPAAPVEAGWTEPAGPAGRATPRSAGTLDAVRAELVRAGVDPRYLDPFMDGFARSAAPFLGARESVRDAMREYLAARLPVVRDWKARPAGHTVAFVGQSGVGKTSAAAALAGRHRAAGLTVALIAAGGGPHDALEGHARRMDVQLFRAPDPATLARLRETLVDRDLVVVDTAGRSHQQLAEMEELAGLLGPAKVDDVTLVLPLATPLADLGDVQRRFRMVGVNRLALSKLDETRHLGNLVNVPLRMGKPLAFLSDGTSVPDALAPADARRIAEMILP